MKDTQLLRVFLFWFKFEFMIQYNQTVNIEESAEADWLQWMKEQQIPDILATGMFVQARMFRLLDIEESAGTATYAVQLMTETREHLDIYQMKYEPALDQAHEKRYGNKAVSFRTMMKEVWEEIELLMRWFGELLVALSVMFINFIF